MVTFKLILRPTVYSCAIRPAQHHKMHIQSLPMCKYRERPPQRLSPPLSPSLTASLAQASRKGDSNKVEDHIQGPAPQTTTPT